MAGTSERFEYRVLFRGKPYDERLAGTDLHHLLGLLEDRVHQGVDRDEFTIETRTVTVTRAYSRWRQIEVAGG